MPEVQRNLATVALAIAKYEPVSMLVRKKDRAIAEKFVGDAAELLTFPIEDLWMRDTGPVFVVDDHGQKAAVDFNFNGCGEKQAFDRDRTVAGFVATTPGFRPVATSLVLEGGGIEVDGQGTAIITDGHTDFYARFARPGVVVAGYDPDPRSFDHAVTKRHLEILRATSDAQGRKLEVVVLDAPSIVREKFANDDFAAGYINFYVCNGAVIAPEFGDTTADHSAKTKLQSLFPGREIVQLDVDVIAAGGGGIHCATQQEPKA